MKTLTLVSVTAAAIVAGTGIASADIIGDAITIRAINANDASDWAQWSFNGQELITEGGDLSYNTDGSVNLIGGVSGEVLATIEGAGVNYIADPVINLNFDVLGGAGNSIIEVESGELTFGTINNAVASASAAFSVTDNVFPPGGPGATITPTSGAAFLANTDGLAPSGENFASLFASTISFSGGTQAFSENAAAAVIAGDTSSMSSRFQFTLSALDFVSATSTFTVTPAPSGVALLAFGSMVAGTRRRR